MAIFQSSESWQLEAVIKPVQGNQHHLLINSLVPTARRPQHHVQFSSILTAEELRRLRSVIDDALGAVQ